MEKHTWKLAILQFLSDHEEGAKLTEITCHCIELVRLRVIETKVDPDDTTQVAQNIKQSLKAQMQDSLVNKAEDSFVYFITDAGKAWLSQPRPKKPPKKGRNVSAGNIAEPAALD